MFSCAADFFIKFYNKLLHDTPLYNKLSHAVFTADDSILTK